jgi:hypothetical protein
VAGRGFGNGPSKMSPNTEETQSWPSERQEAYPSIPASPKDSFEEDSLLTDDEINRQNQGGVSPILEEPNCSYLRPAKPTFTASKCPQ